MGCNSKCAEREYVRGIVHNLSLSRWTDQEIVDYLNKEKGIDIARTTVNSIRNQVCKQAEKWYLELRNSTYKYIANYKERIDSLFSYQKKLHEIIQATKKDEVKIRAISELHSIEMSIFSLWKSLPELDIVDKVKERERLKQEQERDEYVPIVDVEDINGVEEIPERDKGLWHNWIQCHGCNRYWRGQRLLDNHKKMSRASPSSSNPTCSIPQPESEPVF